MSRNFTDEQRAFVVSFYLENKGNTENHKKVLKEQFEVKFPDRKAPTSSAILKMVKKFRTKFSVSSQHPGCKPTVCTEENVELVRGVLQRDKNLPSDAPNYNSARHNELGLDKSSWNKITKHLLNFHPYK